jgi:hypothetical protein
MKTMLFSATYVLTDAGVSATATIAVLRVQPYSID